jgi:hypothetical protein
MLQTAAGIIITIPDDSVSSVALQTFLAIPLGVVVPVFGVVGASFLSKIKA